MVLQLDVCERPPFANPVTAGCNIGIYIMPQYKSKNTYTNNYCYLLLNTAQPSGILITKQQSAY